MKHDHGNGSRASLSTLEIECAIVDGINTYLRDVLEPRGIIDPEKFDDGAGSELCDLKHQIASRLASGLIQAANENA